MTSRRQALGTRATARAVHRKWAATVHHVEHAPYITKVTMRVRQRGQQNDTDLALMPIHMPSAIGHRLEELCMVMSSSEQIIPGKRVMCTFGEDLNVELMDPRANDGDAHIGAALARTDPLRPSDHHELMRVLARLRSEVAQHVRQVLEEGLHRRLRRQG